MRVIGVVDLRGGQAVHARAGRREEYAPIQRVAGVAIRAGDAVGLARVYLDRLGIRELYVADLDAILGGPPQQTIVAAIAELGAPVWLDAGVTSVDGARRGVTSGASRLVVGLETLRSFDALNEISATFGGQRVAFSLDLRDGEPVVASEGMGGSPASLASRAVAAGAGTVIVLDLARIGTDAGIDSALLTTVREAVPGVTLVAGGGVRTARSWRRRCSTGAWAPVKSRPQGISRGSGDRPPTDRSSLPPPSRWR
jgi:phosphoribosylformimino-5-aminoimidazole carboxamide ribotide isomerase